MASSMLLPLNSEYSFERYSGEKNDCQKDEKWHRNNMLRKEEVIEEEENVIYE